MAHGDVYRLGIRYDTVLVTRDVMPSAARESPTPESRTLLERVVMELRWRAEANDRAAIGWLRETCDLGLGPLDPDCGVSPSSYAVETWLSSLESAIAFGTVRLELEPRRPLPPPPDEPTVQPPNPPPVPRDATDTLFDVRFVDEIGQAIGGLEVEFAVGSEFYDVTTNPAGVALLEHVVGSSASVGIADVQALDELLDPRWSKFRRGKPPSVSNMVRLAFDGSDLGAVPVKPVIPHTVVITPPLGKLFVELWDKMGRVRLAGSDYTIDGPVGYSGKTDEQGRLSHDDVFPGDYTLSFTLQFFDGDDKTVDKYESPLVVLPSGTFEPQVRLLGALPRVELARIHGLMFDTSKSFVLPTAVSGFVQVKDLYRKNAPAKVLVVGHADTEGAADYNDALSLERAKAVLAFLEHDTDQWLQHYDDSVPEEKRWGRPEDVMMLTTLPDCSTKPKGEDVVEWFQRTRGLEVDGKAGPETRRQLIVEYMRLGGLSLDDDGVDVDATVHGCGENFPLADSSDAADETPDDSKDDAADETPDDSKDDAADRRVELFFFDPEFGILPPPPGDNSQAGSSEYPEWCKRASLQHDQPIDALDDAVFVVRRLDDDEPAAGVLAVIALPDGTTIQERTDDAGVVRVRGAAGASFRLVGIIDDENHLKLTSVGKTEALA